MAKLKIKGKELRAIGYPEGPVISVAMSLVEKRFKRKDKDQAFTMLQKILDAPSDYINDEVWGSIAEKLLTAKKVVPEETVSISKKGIPFEVFGREYIEEGAFLQMTQASRLPVAVAGALMPDAHQGYGLPIGGVLAVKDAVIPYGVGVDIGCRMCLSIFDIPPGELTEKENLFTQILNSSTLFGAGRQFDKMHAHNILSRKEFDEISLLRGGYQSCVHHY